MDGYKNLKKAYILDIIYLIYSKRIYMQVALNIPEFVPVSLNQSVEELGDSIKLNAALIFFKNGKFSLEQAAKFSNLDIYDFIKECKKNQISVVNYTEEELKEELALLDSI